LLAALKTKMWPARSDETARPRLRRNHWPEVVYAIGDVHGCLDQLRAVEALIIEDARSYEGEKLIVMLGDYVDRGPDSAGVLDHLISPPPPGFERICLAGNHEVIMADFFEQPRDLAGWMSLGGDVTLTSFGLVPSRLANLGETKRRALLSAHIPRQHVEFLNALPAALQFPGVTFVHAGMRPGVDLEDQSERDLLWMRPDARDDMSREGHMVIHGHTPAAEPVLLPTRICLDTAVCATGKLTGLRLSRIGIRIIQS
jgi:serine/threonine protein phosphatase 1